MNETEKKIEYQKELKLFRKAMYLIERESLDGWRKTYLNFQGCFFFIFIFIIMGVLAGDDLSFGRQLLNLVFVVLISGLFYWIHFKSKLLLKWLQLKKKSGYKVDYRFSREKNKESVKI